MAPEQGGEAGAGSGAGFRIRETSLWISTDVVGRTTP